MSNKHLAYGPDRHAVETVMRLHSVKRWHMIDTTRQQTLAEHSANVALLAMTIAMTSPNPHFDKPGMIAAYGLTHDLPEAFTGDIPTHTKGHLAGLDVLEQSVMHPVFNRVNGEGRVPVLKDTKLLVKLCDLADGIRFVRLHGVDMTARHAREGLEEQLSHRLAEAADELQWPEAVLKHVRSNIMFYAYENS
jgi:5'-deoxynucleotidase YfbR-like HD superfamily hydrolase